MPPSIRRKRYWLRRLTKNIPVVPATFTLAETQSFLTSRILEFDTIDYIYVTDADGKLTGIFSIKELYRHPGTQKVSDISVKAPLITARADSHGEEIAHLALAHGLKAVPVVNATGKLLGIIPHDGITAILHRELREDILKLTGVVRGHLEYDNVMQISLFSTVKHRLPWLVAGTLGGLVIAQIIGQFLHTLENNLVLATFIPLVVYIADAVGTQLEAFVVRDFALFRKLDFGRYFAKHLFAVLLLALILGIATGLFSLILYRRIDLSSVLGLSVAAATVSAVFSGLIVPYIFRKLKVDPANASGPLGTIIQDAVSVAVYFTMASLLL